MSDTTGIRITAATKDQAERARDYLLRISDGHVALQPPRQGRGAEWLAYGTVRVPDADPPRLAALVAAWQTGHPGIDAVGVIERLIAEEFSQIDQDIEAAGQWAAGGATLDDPPGEHPADDQEGSS